MPEPDKMAEALTGAAPTQEQMKKFTEVMMDASTIATMMVVDNMDVDEESKQMFKEYTKYQMEM